ncbi:hypothetical protein [Marivirga arenosa]|uniref:Uncharacterized protein n=1 Tax=Marivirga arenosa TaxID=3059076 RepID=A0AA49GDW2_9BACT|nr:hypothetical protein [Marivirga sp. BKB1-2]WKK82934.2 hypothetical protein QYS47_13580 [Marivirga sp. BKB1-2]
MRFKRKQRFEHYPSTLTGRLLKNKFFLAFFVVSITIVVYSAFKDSKNRNDWIATNKNNCQSYKSVYFQGQIDSTYEDKDNRYLFTAIVESRDSIFSISSWYIDYPEAYFKKGDYIIKEANGFIYKIIRPQQSSDTIRIKSDFDCNRWEKHRK